MLKAAIEFGKQLGIPILIGAENRVKEQLKKIGLDENYKIEIVNSTDKKRGRNMLSICTKTSKRRSARKRCRSSCKNEMLGIFNDSLQRCRCNGYRKYQTLCCVY